MSKSVVVILLLAVAAGAYVLGAKAGKRRFREISGIASDVWNDPGLKKVRDRAYRRIESTAKRVAKKI